MLRTSSAIAILTGVLAATSAFAQTVAAPPAPSASLVEEVVVTAERRSETVQKAPQSITAITGVQLQAQGITSVAQLGTEIPGISESSGGPGQTIYAMRGMSSYGGTSPTVGFYLDDASLTSPVSITQSHIVVDPDLYDLNRVEVLRGPQGTLYGSGSMGGTIRLITNQPNPHEFGASVQVTGSGTDGGGANGKVSAMINIPIVDDKLALRIVGTDGYTSGWIDRIVESDFPLPTNGGATRGNVLAVTPSAEHPNSNWNRLEGVRASLLWQPNDNLTMSPTFMYQAIKQGGPNYIDQPPGVSHEAHYQPFDIAEPFSDKFQLYTLPIKYNHGNIQFDSVTAYYDRRSSLTQDNSEYGQDFLDAYLGVPATFAQAGPLTAFENDHSDQFSQEFRISSTGEAPFQWLAGFYYQDFNTNAAASTSIPDAYVAGLLGPGPYFFINQKTNIKQYAGFGETSYKLGDFKLTAGLRYFSFDTKALLTEGGTLIGPTSTTDLPASASGVSPRFNLSYAPSNDLTLYAQAAKGFRPGAGIAPAPTTCTATPSQYSPDGEWSYEAGEKARFFNQRLTVNASVYYEDWSGIQQLIVQPCGYGYTTNAGSAHIYGAEVEASWRLTPEITLSTGLGYAHATLASVLPGSGFAVGQRIQGVPEWTDTTSLVYTRRLNDDYDLVFRATDEYVGNQQDATLSLNTVPARNLVNLRLGLSGKQRISAWIFANNVTDVKTIVEDAGQIFLYVPSINRAVANQPRTIGLELDYAF